jgi:hypothetical protein
LALERPEGVTFARIAGALAGAASLTASYAIARRLGLTRIDLADRLVPGRPAAGRAAQVSAGAAACLPAAWVGTPARGLVAGGIAGSVAAATVERRSDRLLAVVTRGLAGLVAGGVSRAARERCAGG